MVGSESATESLFPGQEDLLRNVTETAENTINSDIAVPEVHGLILDWFPSG